MKANELRVGNLISHNKTPQEVISIFTYIDNTPTLICAPFEIETEITEFEPIPLTAGWLIKFGFGKLISRNWYSNDQYAIEMCKNFIQFDVGYTTITLDCMFVHQLQNIYFTLTGEELTIKK